METLKGWASSKSAVVNAASRRAGQEEMNPVETSTPGNADIRSAVRSIPITSCGARSVASAATFGP